MKHPDNQFTIEEVEKLCQLYMDCQLSLLEETELEYVLMQSDFESPLINETKVMMAVSRSFKLKATKPHKSIWTWGLRVAACAALILGTIAIFRFNSHKDLNHCNENCIVYVAGERVNSKEAQKIAEADVAKMQKFMQVVNERQAQEEAKVEQFMNYINQTR